MALSVDTPVIEVVGRGSGRGSIPCGADAVVYEGAMISESDADSGEVTAGYGQPLESGETFVGHAVDGVDATDEDDGALNILLRTGRYSLVVTLTGVAITDVGAAVYASDDATLTLTASTHTQVGKVARYVSANTAVVDFETLL